MGAGRRGGGFVGLKTGWDGKESVYVRNYVTSVAAPIDLTCGFLNTGRCPKSEGKF